MRSSCCPKQTEMSNCCEIWRSSSDRNPASINIQRTWRSILRKKGATNDRLWFPMGQRTSIAIDPHPDELLPPNSCNDIRRHPKGLDHKDSIRPYRDNECIGIYHPSPRYMWCPVAPLLLSFGTSGSFLFSDTISNLR